MAVDPRGADLKWMLAEDPGASYEEYARHLAATFLPGTAPA